MGFFDSFTSAVGTGLSFAGGFLGGLATSPIGQAFISPLISRGVSEFTDLIGLEPAGFTGSAGITGAPRGLLAGPLGSPALLPFVAPSFSQPRPDQLLTPQRLAEEVAFFQPGGAGTALVRGPTRPGFSGPMPVRPVLTAPPPSIPASQPFGHQPGAGGGFQVPAFPVTTQASFPPSAFALATGVPGFQQAGLAGTLLRQLPGIVGGFAGGAALEGLGAFGGGGVSTPMFRPTMAGARAMFFRTQNPATGQDTWFRPAGRPLLWSGDLTACRRVKKIARKAARKR